MCAAHISIRSKKGTITGLRYQPFIKASRNAELRMLFGRDIFLQAKPKFKPVGRNIVQQIRACLAIHYPKYAHAIRLIQQVAGNEINSANFKIQTDTSRFLLKRRALLSHHASRAFEARRRLMAKLQTIRFPRLLAGKSGTYIIRHDGYDWLLMEFVEGKPFDGCRQDWTAIGLRIGEMFYALRKLPVYGTRWETRTYFTPSEEEVFEWLQEMQKQNTPKSNPLYPLLGPAWKKFERFYADARSAWQALQQVPESICHIDLHPLNLFIEPDGKICFLDMDAIQAGNPVVSMGYAAFKLMRNVIVAYKWGSHPKKIQAARRSFIAALLASGGLKRYEAPWLVAGAKVEIVKRLLWIVRDWREQQSRQWIHILPVQIKAMEEVTILMEPSHA